MAEQIDLFTDPAPETDPRMEIENLLKRPRWNVQEAAAYLGCSDEHVYNLIYEGAVTATNIALDPSTQRACYRLWRDDVVAFEESRKEGAPSNT